MAKTRETPRKVKMRNVKKAVPRQKGKISNSVSLQEENNTKGMNMTKAHSKHKPPKSGQKEEGNTKINALARRKA